MVAAVSAERAIPRHVLELDVQLAKLGRSEARLKLRVGELLDALFVRGGHHELGFSSFDGYVAERCCWSSSWGRQARRLAKAIRARHLVGLRSAIRAGAVSWSMAETLARHATRENEEDLLREASVSSISAMKAKLSGGTRDDPSDDDVEEQKIRPTQWMSDDELLMVHSSRVVVERLEGRRVSDEILLNALLGEAETTLQSIEERLGITSRHVAPQEAGELEALAAALRPRRVSSGGESPEPIAPRVALQLEDDLPLPQGIAELDREIVERCRELAGRNLEIGRLSRELIACLGWRVLGYASAEEYGRERVGLCLSSLQHLRLLSDRTARYPALAEAVGEGLIGYEAALQVSRVIGDRASAELVAAWIERARRRTVKHLREEVAAVWTAVSLDVEASRWPPSEAELEAAFELTRQVQSGEALRACFAAGPDGEAEPVSEPVSEPEPAPEPEVAAQTSDGPSASRPRRPSRFRVTPELFAHWKRVESQLHAVAGSKASFITFACVSLWETWLPYLELWDDKWKHIYARDRHQCSNPVCERRDVTPHHIDFKGRGGGDEEENVTSLCAWCHLQGIHRGRLRLAGEAPNDLRWAIGREPIIVVNGREKVSG